MLDYNNNSQAPKSQLGEKYIDFFQKQDTQFLNINF